MFLLHLDHVLTFHDYLIMYRLMLSYQKHQVKRIRFVTKFSVRTYILAPTFTFSFQPRRLLASLHDLITGQGTRIYCWCAINCKFVITPGNDSINQ